LQEELAPLLEQGWELKSTCKASRKVPERPSALVRGLERGDYTEFDFLKRVFTTKITFNNTTTNFFQTLLDITNNNLRAHRDTSTAKHKNCKYNPVDITTLWRFYAVYMMHNLQEAGNAQKLKDIDQDKIINYLGKNRYKVFIFDILILLTHFLFCI
jgi:hypothetical protein